MKRIILIGQGASGKTFLAFNIAAAFDNVAENTMSKEADDKLKSRLVTCEP
jgi:nitrogenase subunit NifH